MLDGDCVIGVDGGGSHTRAALVGRDGRIVEVVHGSGGNFQQIGLEGLERLLRDMLGAWVESPNGVRPRAMCLGLAGAGRQAEQEAITTHFEALGWVGRVRVESDARTALAGAHAGQAGIIAIAGTGSMVLGVNEEGEWVRAGGWGPILGDEGSGYDIALRGVRAALAVHDGSGPDTVLDSVLRQELGVSEWSQLVARVYGGDLDRARIAALAPLVLQAAKEGDAVAMSVVDGAVLGLSGQIAAVARRLHADGRARLAYSGGVVVGSSLLREKIGRQLAAQGCIVENAPLRLAPVLGAALLAWEHVGVKLEAVAVDVLEGSGGALLAET